ncbi:PcfJ domain-containing protein, partial [Sulfurimonas sp.]|uniref:PcfJ domain-containing protein n=2 Tax=Sulfurimonas TaxID=202746 RepID=UPI0025EDD3BA
MDERIQEIKKLLVNDAKEYLFQNLFENKPNIIDWIEEVDIKNLDIDQKFRCLQYFLGHSHLKEMNMFHWQMNMLQTFTLEYQSEQKMLQFIINNKEEKSIKKAFYITYENSLKVTGYYPYSDFVFSRTIDDKNFLTQLLSIYPAVKQHIFSDENFSNAIEFIHFLKLHYTEKQIVKIFLMEMQEEQTKSRALSHWIDTLRLMQIAGMFEYLEEHFWKVKRNTKNLHDEITRISHLAAFDRGDHSTLVYKSHQNSVEVAVEDLEFRLPVDTVELSEWAKELHNCMFGYVNTIKSGRSIIYGVFRADELLYAIELRAVKIAQALGKFNRKIDEVDMDIIKKWHNENYIKSIT